MASGGPQDPPQLVDEDVDCRCSGACSGCRRSERGVTVTITDAGRAVLAQVLPGHTEVISRQLFQPLTSADTQALVALLTPVRDHMRSQPPRSAAPRRRR